MTDVRSTSPSHEAAELIKLNIPLHETSHEATVQPVWNELRDARSRRPPPEATAPAKPSWNDDARSTKPLVKQFAKPVALEMSDYKM